MQENKLLKPTFFSKGDINNPKNINIKELEDKKEIDKGIPLMKPTFFKDAADNPKKKTCLSNKKEKKINLGQRKHL